MHAHTRHTIAVNVSRTFRGARQLFYTGARRRSYPPSHHCLYMHRFPTHYPLIPDHRESIFILYIRRTVCVPCDVFFITYPHVLLVINLDRELNTHLGINIVLVVYNTTSAVLTPYTSNTTRLH